MLSVAMKSECRYAECRHTECRGTTISSSRENLFVGTKPFYSGRSGPLKKNDLTLITLLDNVDGMEFSFFFFLIFLFFPFAIHYMKKRHDFTI